MLLTYKEYSFPTLTEKFGFWWIIQNMTYGYVISISILQYWNLACQDLGLSCDVFLRDKVLYKIPHSFFPFFTMSIIDVFKSHAL